MKTLYVLLIFVLMHCRAGAVANFNTKGINEFVNGTTRQLTVTLNIDVAMVPDDKIIISGLTGAETPNNDALNIKGPEAYKFGNDGKWIKLSGKLTLTATSNHDEGADITFRIDLQEPTAANSAIPTVATIWSNGNIQETNLDNNGQNAILKVNIIVLKRSIKEEQDMNTRKLTVTLFVNVKMTPGDTITISGLEGSGTADNDALAVQGTHKDKFAGAGHWTKNSGTLKLTAVNDHDANTDLIFRIDLEAPALANNVNAKVATDWENGNIVETDLFGCILSVPVIAAKKRISEIANDVTRTRAFTITLNFNTPIKLGDIVTIEGLTGSPSINNNALTISGTNADVFNNRGAWLKTTGTLTLTAAVNNHVANSDITFGFVLDSPLTKNTAVTPKISVLATSGNNLLLIPLYTVGDILRAAGFTTQPYVVRGSNRTQLFVKYTVDSQDETITCGAYKAWSIKPTSVELIDGISDSIFNDTEFLEKYVARGKTPNVQKDVESTTTINGLSPYTPYDIYCVTESHVFGTSELYDIYTYGLKELPKLYTDLNNDIKVGYIFTDTYSGNTWYTKGICTTNPIYNDDEEGCKGEGTCADASGVVGNGLAYSNNQNACEVATDCGDQISNDPCVWNSTYTWSNTVGCSNSAYGNEYDCIETDGVCESESGGVGDGGMFTTRSTCEASCAVCGNDPCVWTGINNTWIDGSSCSDDTYDTPRTCDKILSDLTCALLPSLSSTNLLQSITTDSILAQPHGASNGAKTNLDTTSSGWGVGATLDIQITNGIVIDVDVDDSGAVGYEPGDTLTVSKTLLDANLDLIFILGIDPYVFVATNHSDYSSLKASLLASPFSSKFKLYMFCLTDATISEMVNIYKLSAGPDPKLMIGTTHVELTANINLDAEIDVTSNLTIKTSDGSVYEISKTGTSSVQRFFNVKENGHLYLYHLNLTLGDVSGKPAGNVDCSGRNGGAICLEHESSTLFLSNVSFYNNIAGIGGSGGAVFAPRGYVEIEFVFAFNNYQPGNIQKPFKICSNYIFEHNMPDVYFDANPMNETFFFYEGWKCNGKGTDVTELITKNTD
jgi:hypothetical protein